MGRHLNVLVLPRRRFRNSSTAIDSCSEVSGKDKPENAGFSDRTAPQACTRGSPIPRRQNLRSNATRL
jgi:hypothetical protein